MTTTKTMSVGEFENIYQHGYVYRTDPGVNQGNTIAQRSFLDAKGNTATVVGLGIDCSSLATRFLWENGYNIPYKSTGLVMPSLGTLAPGADKYFDGVQSQDVKPGDLVYFTLNGVGHVGVVQSWDPVLKEGVVFQAGVHGVQKQDFSAASGMAGSGTLRGFVRPKEEWREGENADAAAQRLREAVRQEEAAVLRYQQTGQPDAVLTQQNGKSPDVSVADYQRRVDVLGQAVAGKQDISGLSVQERIDRLKPSDEEFARIKEEIAAIEAKGKNLDPSALNFGYGLGAGGTYLGRYQLNADALSEVGYFDKASGSWTGKDGIYSKADFLASPLAQDNALRLRLEQKAELAVKNALDRYVGDTVGGLGITETNLLVAMHSRPEHTRQFLTSGGEIDPKDGNQKPISAYLKASGSSNAGLSLAESIGGGDELANQSKGGCGDELSAISGEMAALGAPGDYACVDSTTGIGETKSNINASAPESLAANSTSPQVLKPVSSASLGETEVAELPGGLYLVSASTDKGVTSALLAPDGSLLLKAEPGQILTRDPETGRVVVATPGEAMAVCYDPQAPDDPETGKIRLVRVGEGSSLPDPDLGALAEPSASAASGDGASPEGAQSPQSALSPDPAPKVTEKPLAEPSASVAPSGEGDLNLSPTGETLTVSGDAPQPTKPSTLSSEATTLLNAYQQNQALSAALVGAQKGDALSVLKAGALLVKQVDTALNSTESKSTPPQAAPGSGAVDNGVPQESQSSQTGQPSETPAENTAGGGSNSSAGTQGSNLSAYSQGVLSAVNLVQALNSGNTLSAVIGAANLANTVASSITTSPVFDGGQMGALGALAGALNFVDVLEQGDALGALGAGVQVASYATSALSTYYAGVAFEATASGVMNLAAESAALSLASASSTMTDAVPVIGMLSAAVQGDALGVVIAAIGCIPGYGWAVAAVLNIARCCGLFGGGDEGEPPYIWVKATGDGEFIRQEDGSIAINASGTDQHKSTEGAEVYAGSTGGNAVHNALQGLLGDLQDQINAHNAANPDAPLALVPERLPEVHWRDPAYYLQWTDAETGATRSFATSATYLADTLKQVAQLSQATVPQWQADTITAHLKAGEPEAWQASHSPVAEQHEDGSQSRHILTLGAAEMTGVVVSDIDGDGWYEAHGWNPNALYLGLDTAGDGKIAGFADLLITEGDAHAPNRLGWLDANGDHKLDASDPAFAVLKLWLDSNGNASEDSGEAVTLAQAGIVALDFSSNPPQLIDKSGATQALTPALLTGAIAGVKVQSAVGGTLVYHEEGGAEQMAVVTGDLTGDPEHVHQEIQTITVGDTRLKSDPATLATATPKTATTIQVGDTRLTSSQSTLTLNTTTAASATVTPGTAIRLAFVPLGSGAETPTQSIKAVTAGMIQSAQNDWLGAGMSLGALAAVGLGAGEGAAQAAEQVAYQNAVLENQPGYRRDVAPPPAANTPEQGAAQMPAPPAAEAHGLEPVWVNVQTVVSSGIATAGASGLLPTSESGAAAVTVSAATTIPRSEISAPILVAATVASTPFGPSVSSRSVASPVSQPTVTVPEVQAVAEIVPQLAAAMNNIQLPLPVVQGEVLPGTEDTVFRLAESVLLANDSTANAQGGGSLGALHIISVYGANHGSVSLQQADDGSTEVIFMPDAEFHGAASFAYTVSDAYGQTGDAVATLDIAAVNDAPVTQGETATINEDTALTFTPAQLLGNDSDVDTATDDQVLSISRVGNASHGTVSLDLNGNVRFLPDSNYHGPAAFTYWVSDGAGAETPATVNVTVAAVNDAPVTQGESFTGTEDITKLIAVAELLANDSDVDGATDWQVLRVSTVQATAQTHGTVSLETAGDGSQQVRYVPDANYHGTASFTYTVSDGNGGETPATATITVGAVNDAPVTQGETATINEDTALTFTSAQLLGNDSDVDTATDDQVLSISRVGNASHGTVSLDANGNVRFLPDSNYHGVAAFTYWVSDGAGAETPATVNVTVTAVNDAPVTQGETFSGTEDITKLIAVADLLANDSDVDVVTDGQVLRVCAVQATAQIHGTVSLETAGDGSQQVRYVPDTNFHGTASFTYTVSDGNGGEIPATAMITVGAVNDAPVTQGETATINEDTALTFTSAQLLGNDSDVDTATDGQVLSISRVGNASHGTVSLDASGKVRFLPDSNYHGVAAFTYWVSDGAGAETPATVNVTVAAVNDAPVTQGESFTGTEDITKLIAVADLLANDSDVDVVTGGQVLRVSGVQATAQTHGTVSLETLGDGSQQVRYAPEANYHGTASFTYTVSDGNGGETPATATLTVEAVNDVPVTQGETTTINEDTALTFTSAQLLGNDSDVDTATDGQLLAITAVKLATHGTVRLLANGDVRFDPDVDYHGPAEFYYTVSDGRGGQTDARVSLNILPVNDTPVAVGDLLALTEDAALVVGPAQLLANDADRDIATDGDVLHITRVYAPEHCAASLGDDGNITILPEANYHGLLRFAYEIADTQGALSTAWVVAGVNAVNDAPVAVADAGTGSEDLTLLLDPVVILANDTDNDIATDGDNLTIASVSDGVNGRVRLLPDGRVEFVPDPDFHGVASFAYTVRDQFGAISSARMTLDIAAVNDAPVTQGESFTGTEDLTKIIAVADLLANDSDADVATDGQVLRVSAVQATAQTHGTVSLETLVDGGRQVRYVPEANYHGTASFTYMVSDGNGGETPATATITVGAVNDAPVTQGETATINEDTALTFTSAQLLGNDSDVDTATDGQVLSIIRVGNATHGTVSLDASGNIRFLPDSNYHGPAAFTYWVSDGAGAETPATVNLTVTAVNDAPVTQGESFTGTEDLTKIIAVADLLANDSDVDVATDGQVLRVSAVQATAQTHGTVTLQTLADNSQQVLYVPDANYHGTASFTYMVSDGNGGETPATATITVGAVNDAPVTQGETATINEDTALTFISAQLLGNDSDVDTATDDQVLSISRVGNASHGTVSLDANGNVRFLPDSNYHGPAAFTYWVSDGAGAETSATVNVTVAAVNDAPVTQGESFTGTEDLTKIIAVADLLANDSDVDVVTDGQVLRVSAVQATAQTHGTVSLETAGDGSQQVRYVPDANYHGTASFTYTVSDGNGGETPATATITVGAVNDVPVTQGETATINEDTALTFTSAQLLGNDSDVDTATDDQVLSISRVGNASHGTVSLDANGNVRFLPDSNYHGVAAFTYWVSDGAGAETPATVSVTVTAVNDAPVTQGESFTGTEDITKLIAVAELLANDSDVDVVTDGQVLRVSAVQATAQTHGTVSLETAGDGSQQVRYVPDTNFHGTASFTYTVSDGNGGETPATATITVGAVNDAPVTQGETATINEDTALTFTSAQLLGNDSDVDTLTDGQSLSISRVGNASHGTVSLDASGNVRFVPGSNYHGPAAFTYWVSDGAGAETPAVVNVTVTAVNDAPVTQGETAGTGEDIGLIFTAAQLLANDSDADTATDGQILTISRVGNATHGTVSFDDSGNIRFVPDANYHGPAVFSYWVSDGAGVETVASVNLTVAAVNDVPVIQGEITATDEDVGFVFASAQLLANDSDVDVATDGQVLGISRVGNASHGVVSLDANGSVRFVPDANYHGAATFTYWVADGAGGETPATVNVTVIAVNDVPLAVGESASGSEDTGLIFSQAQLLANDSDADTFTDGQALSVSRVGNASHGEVSLDASGNVRFMPDANYHGAASFTYWVADGTGAETPAVVALDLAAVNDLPATQGESFSGTEDISKVIAIADLLANDSDADTATDGQVLRVGAVQATAQTHGTVTLQTLGDGSQQVVYVPEANFHVTASFTYTVSDGAGGLVPATATISVLAVNDVPVAQGETTTTNEDVGLLFTSAQLLANDSDADVVTDGQVLTISRVGSASHGVVSLEASGNVRFLADSNYHGPASFTYWVDDGAGAEVPATVSVNVMAVNDLPVAVGEVVSGDEDVVLRFDPALLLANDSDVDVATDGQALQITGVSNAVRGSVQILGNGQVEFTPDANYFGVASFAYTVSDGNGGTAQTTVVLNLAEINDAPAARDDTLDNGLEDTTKHISLTQLLANDSDVDASNGSLGGSNDSFSLYAVGNASHGSVTMAGGEVVFIPDANYHGAASFDYQIRDGAGVLAQATARFTVDAVNDAPVAVGEAINSLEDQILTIATAALLANDDDVDEATDGQVLSITEAGDARHGTARLLGDGNIEFTPDDNYNGLASFTYTVSDGAGGAVLATATLNIAAINDAPRVVNETITGKSGVPLVIAEAALLVNDADVEGDTLSLVSVSSVTHGAVSIQGEGALRFTPDSGFSGIAGFDYTVSDGQGGVASGHASLDLTRQNIAPTVVDDQLSGTEDIAVLIDPVILLANDSDPDNAHNSMSISAVSTARHGTVSIQGDGKIRFTPDANYNGAAGFTYTVVDGDGGSMQGQVLIDIAAVNDAPVITSASFFSGSAGDGKVNAYDLEGSALTYTLLTAPVHGSAVVANQPGDGMYVHTWTPTWQESVQGEGLSYGVAVSGSPVVGDTPPSGRALNSDVYYDPSGGGYSILALTWRRSPDVWVSNFDPGHFIYGSTYGDGYSGSDPFQVKVTDAEGASTTVTVNAYHTGSTTGGGGGGGKPVTLDLDGNGLQFTGLDDSKVYFDINGDGWREHMAWVGGNDALLALDTQGDGVIDKAEEISFIAYTPGAWTDLEGLKAFDTNQDSVLDKLDARWRQFGAWQDRNHDGVCEPGEFLSLDEVGITRIALESNHVLQQLGDTTVFGTAQFARGDGSTGAVGDVAFKVDAADRLPAHPWPTAAETEAASVLFEVAVATSKPSDPGVVPPNTTLMGAESLSMTAEVSRLALLFSQSVSTQVVAIENQPAVAWVDLAAICIATGQPEIEPPADLISKGG